MERFDQLVRENQAMIYKLIQNLHIYKNEDEFYQIGLIALWEAKERYIEGKSKFSTYAYSFIKGRLLNELSRQKNLEDRNVYPTEEFWELIEDEREHNEVNKIMSYCTGLNLTRNQLKWVLYTAVGNLSQMEIAEVEGVSVSAVKAWRKGAVQKLSNKYGNEFN
ncbi:sigma-70 family RNA polymerase sigma factor [Bacillus sp. 31A1R]|uniref:Sigma-70 family RNA polymerase sigma factor n=1 Tax=Robertmurraya mangrovi TaxID=3098077 RepID=A0ABU5IW40_9BACI|nr:sigma-70 family RNA polymerase sigma factor [Bacillus sp. 31A1R]MDZ5471365.1 sigma-70 family RNA polymerase sigma factor [Bacillus sp. 31A1R]